MKIIITIFKTEQKAIEVEKMTNRQLEYIKKIEYFKNTNKRIPSMREIMRMVGCNSPATIKSALDRMAKKGYDYRRTE